MEIAVISDTHMPRATGGSRTPASTAWSSRPDRPCGRPLASVLIGLQHYGPGSPCTATSTTRPRARAAGDRDRRRRGATIAIVHDAGPRLGRLARLRTRFPRAQAVVFGHSHFPLHERDPATGFQIFNPGSPTERRLAPQHTMGIARATAGELTFELIALG